MIQDVDCIGVDSVVKAMKLSGLTRFIIYRQNSGRGFTPVFECINTSQNAKAIEMFKDWAKSMLQLNANSIKEYDMLLFDKQSNVDTVAEEEENESEEKRGKRKSNKIRFSFCLSSANGGMNGNYGMSGNMGETVSQMVQQELDRRELQQLRAEKKKWQDDGGEEEEEDETMSALDKTWMIIQELKKPTKKAARVAGDDDELFETEEEEEEEEEEVETKKAVFTAKQRDNINKACRVLAKYDKKLDVHLVKLAKLAQKDKVTFEMVMSRLDSLKV